MDQFEEACRRAKILLFLNPPHRPELNGGVERSNRTFREEFYEVEDVSLDVGEHNKQLVRYAYCHNYIRPHRALAHRVDVPIRGRVRRRWDKRTPAMAAGLTDHVWTLRGLMSRRILS